MSDRSRFLAFAALVVGVGAVGMVAAALWPGVGEVRRAALLGTGAAAFSGVVGLELKRRALGWSLRWVMGMVGVVFGLRLLLVSVGLVLTVRTGWSGAAFTVGFFTEYFVLQWIEVAFVLAESKRRGQGGV